ncbi:thioredoxin domain-containing protein 12-like [Ptychodera flava]|uniref:thioredoxin domain-containing protein 12-like n=1 Tax=Ptychodera flava TaxID=63121 RepID=UPI003969FB82
MPHSKDTIMASHAILLLCLAVVLPVIYADGLGRGFGDDINWKTLDAGLKESKDLNKPLMLIIHKSWCGACKALKPKFADSSEIKELSEKFVMVNVEDNEEPSDSKYTPDGGYIPRILFLDSTGTVRTELINENGNPQYKYYYPEATSVVKSMKKAADVLIESKAGVDEL